LHSHRPLWKPCEEGDLRPCLRSRRHPSMGAEAIEMAETAKWEGFRQCPGCGFDFATGEGERSCSWGDCPYLPEELNVFCDSCRFNFSTMEGNPPCEDPLTCEHGADARSHVENLRTWNRDRGRAPSATDHPQDHPQKS
jgi:hypothetical protein